LTCREHAAQGISRSVIVAILPPVRLHCHRRPPGRRALSLTPLREARHRPSGRAPAPAPAHRRATLLPRSRTCRSRRASRPPARRVRCALAAPSRGARAPGDGKRGCSLRRDTRVMPCPKWHNRRRRERRAAKRDAAKREDFSEDQRTTARVLTLSAVPRGRPSRYVSEQSPSLGGLAAWRLSSPSSQRPRCTFRAGRTRRRA
jgi:hypothetical protein